MKKVDVEADLKQYLDIKFENVNLALHGHSEADLKKYLDNKFKLIEIMLKYKLDDGEIF